MAEQQLGWMAGFMAHRNQPLIGVISYEQGQEVVHYFTDEAEADAAIPSVAIQEAFSLNRCDCFGEKFNGCHC